MFKIALESGHGHPANQGSPHRLNTKAYYLLVALSFIFALHPQNPPLSFKLALTLTAIVAVLPVQDYFYGSDSWLNSMRILKVILLTMALVCTLWWTWFTAKS